MVPIAVDIPRCGNRPAKVVIRPLAAEDRVGRPGQSLAAAGVKIGPPLEVGMVVGADDDVVITVAVDVPSRPGRVAKVVVHSFPGSDKDGAGVQPSRAAGVDVGPAGELFVPVAADDDVGIAVAIHVARSAHREAKVVVDAFAAGRPAASVRDWLSGTGFPVGLAANQHQPQDAHLTDH